MKRIAVLLLASIVLFACNRDEKELDKDISIPVSVMDLKLQGIEKYVSTTGTVNPVKEVELKSEMAGKYKLLINPKTNKTYALGDYVSAGEVILQLDDKEYENNIKITSLELRLDISKQVYEKQQSLYEKGGVTLSEVKNAEIDYVNAKYAYEDGLLRLSKMKVKAPFDGVIVDLPYHTPGVRIDANLSVIKLMDYSKLQMEINLAEKNMNLIRPGQQVRIMNYTIPDDTLTGKITQISPAISADTRAFKAMVNIANADLKLRPGMYVKGEIIVAAIDSALVIPKDIILSKQRGNTVFVVDKGLAQERIIAFGIENPEAVQVISGLEKNERIVTKGFETLRNRSKVKVVK